MFFIIGGPEIFRKGWRVGSNCTEKFSARNEKFSARNEKIFYLIGKTTAVLGKKRGESPVFAGSLLFAIQRYDIFA